MPEPQSPNERTTSAPEPAGAPDTIAVKASGAKQEQPGDWIGPYKLQSVIGEGGFGVVWLAERREPMVQRVALKIIKPGMDSRSVIARFEQERQALAVMDHPNVARVLDGGVTPAGRPYFVMEYVKGDPITTFADRRKLTLRERLQLFIPVCEAVQHAHMKGLIHRDIKPSNILVAPASEGQGSVVKVIDFGVAKAISQTLTDKTIFTERGQIIGTPEYMSPEQADMGATDIDTRADVYSLGVVLYELLSGTLPFDSASLRSAGYAEIQRIIRDVDPPRPSTRLSAADDRTGVAIALARHAEREKIAGELRRELEWIPMKALRKDRLRRYASAESLGADVRRYLDGKPLEAAPESRGYLFRKFMARNRAPVMAAGAVGLALVAGVVTTGFALNRALQAERGLRTQLAETDKAQKAEKQRADQLKQVSDFQSQMLLRIDTTGAGLELMKDVRQRFGAALERAGIPEPERVSQAELLGGFLALVNATDTAVAMIDRTILKPAIEAIDAQFESQPEVDANLRHAIASLYRYLGLYDAALTLQKAALAKRRSVLGDDHPDTLSSMNNVGSILSFQGKNAEAEPYYREGLERCRRVLGEEHTNTILAINSMGHLLQAQGKYAESERYFREAQEKFVRVLGEEHKYTLTCLGNLGFVLRAQGKLAEAEPFLRETLERRRRALGENHPETLGAILNLGVLFRDQEKLPDAERCYREALEKFGRLLGEEHPTTLVALRELGLVLSAQGKLAEAEPILRDGMEKLRRVQGETNPDTVGMTRSLGIVLQKLGKLREAVDLLAPAEPAARSAFVGDHARRLAGFLTVLAQARAALGYDAARFTQAESNFLEAWPINIKHRGERHEATLECAQGLVDLYAAWDKAEPGKGYDAKAAAWREKLDAVKVDPGK